MADIKINLLPWREEVRQEKKDEFLRVLVGARGCCGVCGCHRVRRGSIL